MAKINWKRFIEEYINNDSHWYVSKIKEYTNKEYKNLIGGLILLELCFIDENSKRGCPGAYIEENQASLSGRLAFGQ